MKGDDEQIAYACCPIGVFSDRFLVESALIYRFQPPINIKQRYSYHHKRTRLVIESKIEFPFVGTWDINQAN